MTTLSTTQLIEAMRTVAVAADTEQGREKLNAIANRMEMLVAANAGMDLQLNSIRSALNIPVNTSVQAGVIAEISRLNDAVLSLRSELSESVVLANKLRRTAKEHQEESQQLRTEMIELNQQRDVLAAENVGLKELYVYNGLSPKHGKHKLEELKKPFIDKLIYSAEYYSVCGHISAATNRAISAVHGDYSWMPKTNQTDKSLCELMARGVEQAALGFHEKAFAAFEGSNEHGLYIRAQLQLLAQQLRDGDA
ncbi:hypothetical protein ACS91J_15880 [Pectobacterium carotovorum]